MGFQANSSARDFLKSDCSDSGDLGPRGESAHTAAAAGRPTTSAPARVARLLWALPGHLGVESGYLVESSWVFCFGVCTLLGWG